jgi:prevent-host-death family protein
MSEIGASEARNSLGGLLDRVVRGEEITITRHGKPVARLVPAVPVIERHKAQAAVARLRALAAELAAEAPITQDEIKAWCDAGRP